MAESTDPPVSTNTVPTAPTCMYVLPWIGISNALSFGDVDVAPAAIAINPAHPYAAAAKAILGTFRLLGGSPAQCTLMWPKDKGPLDLNIADNLLLVRHRTALSASLLCANEYYLQLDAPTTDTHCDAFLQSFTADTQHVSVQKRRREGYFLDGWPIAKLTTSVPLAASPTPQASIEQSLLDAIATALADQTDFGDRMRRAVPMFLQGNRLSETTSMIDDMVWMGAAFERLFDISNDIGKRLSEAVANAFSSYRQTTTTWNHMSRAGNPQPESGPWVQRWMREFYDYRSSIHSGSAVYGNWNEFNHTIIAAEVFALCLKLELAQAGLRDLTEADELRLDAIDDRIAAMTPAPGDPRASWAAPLVAARTRRTTSAIATAIASGDFDEDDAGGDASANPT